MEGNWESNNQRNEGFSLIAGKKVSKLRFFFLLRLSFLKKGKYSLGEKNAYSVFQNKIEESPHQAPPLDPNPLE
jgi:hypothetical protein